MLPHVGSSIRAALRDFEFPWTWWVACDKERMSEVPDYARVVPCGPQADRWATDRFRTMLGMIGDGFVYGLDDDNAMHPRFNSAFRHCVNGFDGFCMPQERRKFYIFPKLYVPPFVTTVRKLEETPRIEEIDLAQYVLKRKLIGDIDWKGGVWDGEIIQDAYSRHPGRIWMAPEPSCYYNYLTEFPRPWWWER
jgi:hypothetical protein